MVRFVVVSFAASLSMMAVAHAGHCPSDAAAIDAYLARAQVEDAVKAQATALKDEGMALHTEGKHGESEAKLAEAMRLLLKGE